MTKLQNNYKIYEKTKKYRTEIRQKLNSMIHSSNYSKFIQKNVITIRNERYVIPVKKKNIVHK